MSHQCEFVCLDLGLRDAGPRSDEPRPFCEYERDSYTECAQGASDGCLSGCGASYLTLRRCVVEVCETRPEDPRCHPPDPWD